MNPREIDELCDAWLEGDLDAEGVARLSALLERSPVARERYWRLAAVHGLIEGVMQRSWAEAAGSGAGAERRVRMRSLRHLAAGVLLGLVVAGAGWLYAMPAGTKWRPLELSDAGFEEGSLREGSPRRFREWAVDAADVVESSGPVRAREGRRMVRFLAASRTGDYPGSPNMASDLWQAVLLPGEGFRTLRVRAWFNADTEPQARFHLAAVAGGDAGANLKQLWDDRYSDSGSLAFARSMTFVDHDPDTWEAGELTLRVPPEARVAIIGVAAYRLPVSSPSEWFPAQFVDDVEVMIAE